MFSYFHFAFFLLGACAARFIDCGIADLPSAGRRESPQNILREM
jgi:hypothetical protein